MVHRYTQIQIERDVAMALIRLKRVGDTYSKVIKRLMRKNAKI